MAESPPYVKAVAVASVPITINRHQHTSLQYFWLNGFYDCRRQIYALQLIYRCDKFCIRTHPWSLPHDHSYKLVVRYCNGVNDWSHCTKVNVIDGSWATSLAGCTELHHPFVLVSDRCHCVGLSLNPVKLITEQHMTARCWVSVGWEIRLDRIVMWDKRQCSNIFWLWLVW